tara:strand:+ start:3366 stop:3545 length:180 start_codon:yes stop_codon:yes gene_type:complete
MNEEIKKLISERLDFGQSKYKQDLPMEDDRDYIQEALEELLDAVIYLAAQVLRLKERRK